jgi:hypothetical protein
MLRYPKLLTQQIVLLLFTLLNIQCSNSASCKAEKSTAKVQSNSPINKVWVSFFNQDTQQNFAVTDVTEDNPKTISSLSPGQYYIQATVYKNGFSPREIRLSAQLKDCYDYNLSVNAIDLNSASMSLSGKPR